MTSSTTLASRPAFLNHHFGPLKLPRNNNHDYDELENTIQPQQKSPFLMTMTKRSLRASLNLQNQSGNPTLVHSTPSYQRPLVVGHRGALYEELENTVPAFTKCVEFGCDMVELDVFLLRDGTLIVFHGGGNDQNPGDLTEYCMDQDGKSILHFPTFQSTQSFQWNPHHPELACPTHKLDQARIPLLKDVLLALRGTGVIVKIELKGEGVTEPVLQLVEEMDMVHQCHFSSFVHDRIALVRQLHPETHTDGSHVYKTGALFHDELESATDEDEDDVVQQALKVGASEVHLKYDQCTKDIIAKIHNAGMSSMAWFRGPVGMKQDSQHKYHDVGNEDIAMYRAVMDTGVRQLCCNRPNVLVHYLHQLYR